MSHEGKREVPEVTGIFNTWVLVHPAEDLPGAWVAHSLEFDVVSQGTSAEHALRMVSEAVGLVLQEDVEQARDPYARRAPVEFWMQLQHMLEHGESAPVAELLERARTATHCLIAIQMFVTPRSLPSGDARPSVRTPLAVRAPEENAHPC
ncbi:MAG TPA: hypothetical protein VF765_11080 [Polyangiaceae bacterium]